MMTGRAIHGHRPALRAAALAAWMLATWAVPSPGRAEVFTVDVNGGGQFTSIQPAMISADSGDTILVAPGTYTGPGNYELDFEWKNLVILSTGGAEETIIDTDGKAGFLLTRQQTQAAMIAGFTLTNAGEGYNAGPIYINGGAATIQDCIFAENHDCVHLEPGFSMSLRGCRFTDTETRALRVKLHEPRTLAIASCVFEGNYYDYQYSTGGGAALRLESPAVHGAVTVDSCSFIGNWARRNGGAVRADGKNITFEHCTFADNHSEGDGGGVHADGKSIAFRYCTFTDNRSDGEGGAMAVTEAPPLDYVGTEITGCTFCGNSSGEYGGAIYRKFVNFTVSECQFDRNSASRGGAICCYLDDLEAAGAPVVHGSTFTDNRATMGAAVICIEAAPEIDLCLFERNHAWLWGGGICADGAYDHRPSITHCTFTRNHAHRGAALLANNQVRPIVEHCTFYGCSGDDGTIVSLVDAFVHVANSVVSFAPRGAPVHLQFATAIVEHCIVFGNVDGDALPEGNPDNLFTDPLFCDVYSGDFTLCENSPCLAANNIWGEPVGAHGEGCGNCDSPVERTSWGAIKALYR